MTIIIITMMMITIVFVITQLLNSIFLPWFSDFQVQHVCDSFQTTVLFYQT